MKPNWHSIIIKLSFLLIPFVILSLILLDGSGGGGIGGGGYDLSGLVYGLALFAVVILWMVYILINYLWIKTTAERKVQHWLLLSGVIALALAWLITPRMF